MALRTILIFGLAALFIRTAGRGRWRGWLMLAASALAVYALQPAMPIRYVDFWLPTLTLALVVLSWVLTTPAENRSWRQEWPAAAVLAGVVLLVAASRYVQLPASLAFNRPPQMPQVLIALAELAGLALLFSRLPVSRKGLWGLFALLLGLLIVLKVPALAQAASAGLRTLSGQSAARAAAVDLRWLGYSYVAFRLLHTVRDRQNNRLPVVSLREYVSYVIFFPAFTAGPIDRLERFLKDLRRDAPLSAEELLTAGQRLTLGVFKKFVLADTLALAALNTTNGLQAHSAGWLWVMVYAYAFQIYFDFSGYTDIAIGLGRLMGIALPENFNHPYLKPNLTQFWNNWHMTLTQWFRAYFFNPLTRALRGGARPLAPVWIILITQVSTMLLIGLWHGVTWNFVAWGLWHGIGLFLQNRWSEWARGSLYARGVPPRWQPWLNVAGVLLTFHFVALGWVWFAISDPAVSARVFLKLFGG